VITNCWYCGFQDSETEHKLCPLCHRPVTKDTSGKHVQAKTVQPKPSSPVAREYTSGVTRVTVMRRDVDDRGKERVREVKKGIIVEQGSLFARVYDNQPVEDGGDPSQVNAEKFPYSSPNCWLVKDGELKYQLRLAPELA
jgi:hypothetical protein